MLQLLSSAKFPFLGDVMMCNVSTALLLMAYSYTFVIQFDYTHYIQNLMQSFFGCNHFFN